MHSRLFAVLLVSVAAGCAQSARPVLGIVLVVDQMRADYLTRFDAQFVGGFRRMLDEGVVFDDAHQDHSVTETAVGHSSISTGTFPRRHGIVGNEFYNRRVGRVMYSAEDTTAPLVGMPDHAELDERSGRSPRNLLAPALGDWMQEAAPGTRVFGVAIKDRSATMMGGHRAHGAFWYHTGAGHYVSSTYYGETLPEWVTAFNATRPFDAFRDTTWTKVADETSYHLSRSDEFAAEGNGRGSAMPHAYSDTSRFYNDILFSPFADEVTLAFARELIEREDLGADGTPDLLMLGISSADYVGHMYGPNSHEVQDYYLRLDRMLGAFFEYLDARVGRDRYVVALSADHGVMAIPEELAERGVAARRVRAEEGAAALREAVMLALSDVPIEVDLAFSSGPVFRYDSSTVSADQVIELREAMARRFRDLDFIADAYPMHTIADGAGTPFMDLYQRNYFAERFPDVSIRGRMNHLILADARGTSHGSPYQYDTHVPIVFMGGGLEGTRVARRVRTVDIAPTLSVLLGTTPPSALDGEVLHEVAR